MTNKDFVKTLTELIDLPTGYNNKYPYNLGYIHDGGKITFDCWNLIKALLNGWQLDGMKRGEFQRTLKITGDIDGAGLLKNCTVKSKDFSKISQQPAGTYLYMPGHSGSYVGEFERNGHTYNVIECTAAWDKRVLASWVDSDGTRRHWKGCKASNGKWTDFGQLKWLEYLDKVTPTLGTPVLPDIPNYYLRKGMRSEEVRKLQKNLNRLGYMGANYRGLDEDGIFGNNTLFALKDFQFRSNLIKDGVYGPLTKAALEKALNERR